jgi:glycosyltransferase involved in cell wall biosynthesis
MAETDPSRSSPRRRLLVTAYHYDREYSMESRLSWQRAQFAAIEYDVTVICARSEDLPPSEGNPAIKVQVLPINAFERTLMRRSVTYYAGYRLWHRRVYRLAKRLHAERPFALAHHVSFCGYREPSDCRKLSVPFVWGPIGGTSPLPTRFLGQLDFYGAVRELARNIANWFQLRLDVRVRRAMQRAECVLAANAQVAADVERAYGVSPAVQLETGIGDVLREARPMRDPEEPLKILWAGRLRSWKGLPLLLRGLARLPADCRYTVRVMGQGDRLACWRRLAERLGIAANVDWVGWPEYGEQLRHYEWADVFAFTSLRDTSGTGLLESLAAGAPIVGLDHQGAADIMTEQCAVRVPVDTPQAAIAGFSNAIMALANDGARLKRMSDAARERAREFAWDRQWKSMRLIYRRAIAFSAGVHAVGIGDSSGMHPASNNGPTSSATLAAATQEAFC